MKIKCPFNCGEYESTPNPENNPCHSELEAHLKDNHDIGIMLSKLLTKIHEKIKERYELLDNHEYEYANVTEGEIKVLESLL